MRRTYQRRHPGTRWRLIPGTYAGPEQFAINELQGRVQFFIPYVLEVAEPGSGVIEEEQHLILTGTPEKNKRIADLVRRKKIRVPAKPESYAIACMDAPGSGPSAKLWKNVKRVLVIAGRDPKGVLNGAVDFNARMLGSKISTDNVLAHRDIFDKMADFNISEEPIVENRGIWSWGYVIYDYKRFFDNMARLRMNMLVVWNDLPPINARELLDYAHGRGIKVVMGFHWGWGFEGIDLTKAEDRSKIKQQVIAEYNQHYRGLPIDGIYFQTLTEHHTKRQGGKSTAKVVCDFVNEVARALLKQHPGLHIQFGLHATSIMGDYADLRGLDPRVVIIWEDAGTAPYSYAPVLTLNPSDKHAHMVGTFEKTLAYSKKVARQHRAFGMCPKGFCNLKWGTEFEHHESFILGERTPQFCKKRYEERLPWWRRIEQMWVPCYDSANRFYREVRKVTRGPMTVVGLVDDGMFEEKIQYSEAAFAEMLWNPNRDTTQILEAAMAPYYQEH